MPVVAASSATLVASYPRRVKPSSAAVSSASRRFRVPGTVRAPVADSYWTDVHPVAYGSECRRAATGQPRSDQSTVAETTNTLPGTVAGRRQKDLLPAGTRGDT